MPNTEQTLSERFSGARKEAEALVWYFARHWSNDAEGKASTGNEVPSEASSAYAALVKTLSASQDKEDESSYQELMISYQKLANYTFAKYGVHGKSIMDTTRQTSSFFDKRRQPVVYGVFFFILALMFQALDTWSELNLALSAAEANTSAVNEGTPNESLGGSADVGVEGANQGIDEASSTTVPEFGLAVVLASCLPLLVPAAWGALGACTALAKRVSDRLSAMTFEENRMQALSSRIFLGAALALVLDILVFVERDQSQQNGLDLGFGPIAGAFLAGLFVKQIYGALENLMGRISQAIAPEQKNS